MVVHEANRVPFPDKDGVSVSAGFSTEIGMRMVGVHCMFMQFFQSIAFHQNTMFNFQLSPVAAAASW